MKAEFYDRNNTRRRSLDVLKTISIVAVVLYHLGVVKNGYLGVEAFFVVSGYSFAKRINWGGA